MAREDVSSVTQKVEARALFDPLSVAADRVSKGIQEVVSIVTLETGAGWGVELGVIPLGRNCGCTVANTFSGIDL